MMTAAESAATYAILAIDLGKYKSVTFLSQLIAGAADAKESTAIRVKRETEANNLQNFAVRLLAREPLTHSAMERPLITLLGSEPRRPAQGDTLPAGRVEPHWTPRTTAELG